MTYAMYSHFNKTHNINIYIYLYYRCILSNLWGGTENGNLGHPKKYEEHHNGTHDIRSSGPKTPHSHHTLSARRAFFAAPGPHDGATGCLKNGVSLCNWIATRVRPPSVMCVGLDMFLFFSKCSWMFLNVFKCINMLINVHECFEMFLNIHKWSWMCINVYNYIYIYKCL